MPEQHDALPDQDENALPSYSVVAKADHAMYLGRRLNSLIMERGMTQSDFARLTKTHDPKGVGIGRDAISCYVRGVRVPNGKNLRIMADALGLKTKDLLPQIPVGGRLKAATTETAKIPSLTDTRAPLDRGSDVLEISPVEGREGVVRLHLQQIVSYETLGRVMALVKMDANER